MALRYFHITQQGSSHIEKKTNCQDASDMKLIRLEQPHGEAVIAAVADGVGSCTFSEYGAQTAVKAVLEYLEKHIGLLKTLDEKSVLPELRAAYQFALEKVEDKADEQYWPLPSLDTTLTTALYLEDGSLFFGHNGDGGIVALYMDGTYEMITARQKGEEFNSVIPLRGKKWQFGKARKKVVSVAMMTDGVLDCVVGTELFQNRVYFPFFKALLSKPRSTAEENRQCESELKAYLSSAKFRERVKDDITLATIQNAALAAQLPDISFDEKAWNEETERISDRVEKSLSKGAKELQAEVNKATSHGQKGASLFPGVEKKPATGQSAATGGASSFQQTGKAATGQSASTGGAFFFQQTGKAATGQSASTGGAFSFQQAGKAATGQSAPTGHASSFQQTGKAATGQSAPTGHASSKVGSDWYVSVQAMLKQVSHSSATASSTGTVIKKDSIRQDSSQNNSSDKTGSNPSV